MDDTDDQTNPPDFESWSNGNTLVNAEWPLPDDQSDDQEDPTPVEVPEWSDYPLRFRSIVYDLATEWWLVSLDCLILVAKRTLSGHFSLDRLANGYLLTISEVNHIIDTVLAERRDFTEVNHLMVPGYRRMNRPIRVPAPLSDHDTPFRGFLIRDLPTAAYSFLVQTRWAVQTFIQSLTPESCPWLFAPHAGDWAMFDLYTTWNQDNGYPFWHDFSSGRIRLFENGLIRSFLVRTLIDSDSGICVGNTNPFFKSVRLRPVESVRTECEKICFVLSWLIVEMREFSAGQMQGTGLEGGQIRKVALEYRIIHALLDTILSLDTELERQLMNWVSFRV